MKEHFGDLIYSRENEEKMKHTPHIEAPDRIKAGEEFMVTVIAGKEVPHPNTAEHHIKCVQVFAEEEGRPYNPIQVATLDLGPAYGEPKVTFSIRLKKTSKLWVLVYCNLHGLWENSKGIEVVE